METAKLKVTGMNCGGCAASVQRALERVPGVASASVELREGEVEVRHENADVQAMTTALEKAGYGAQAI